MKIFFSHASPQKPLVREIVRELHPDMRPWVDEKQLLIGEPIEDSLRTTIENGADYVVLFVSDDSVRSEWVQNELKWALGAESRRGETIVLPIVLSDSAWNVLRPDEFRKRKYLRLASYDLEDVESLASKLNNQMISWLIRKKRGVAPSAPSVPQYEVAIEVKAFHLFPGWATSPPMPDDVWLPAQVASEPDNANGDSTPALPGFSVTLRNRGARLRVEEVVVELGDDSTRPEDAKDIADQMSAFSMLFWSENRKEADFVLDANDKRELSWPPAKGIDVMATAIVKYGVKDIWARDARNNKYYATREDIDSAVNYMRSHFTIERIDDIVRTCFPDAGE